MSSLKTKQDYNQEKKDMTVTSSEIKMIKYLPSRKNIDKNTYAISYQTK